MSTTNIIIESFVKNHSSSHSFHEYLKNMFYIVSVSTLALIGLETSICSKFVHIFVWILFLIPTLALIIVTLIVMSVQLKKSVPHEKIEKKHKKIKLIYQKRIQERMNLLKD